MLRSIVKEKKNLINIYRAVEISHDCKTIHLDMFFEKFNYFYSYLFPNYHVHKCPINSTIVSLNTIEKY